MATAAAKITRSLLAFRLSSSSYFLHSKSLFSTSSSIATSPSLPNLSRLSTLNRSKLSYSPFNSCNNVPASSFTRRDSTWISNLHVRFHSSMVGNHNKQTKFPKHRKGRIEGICDGGNDICFGKYGLQALEPARITSRQLEAGRRALQLNARRGGRGGKVWVRAFAYKSVTSKPAETRMGRGKGSIAHWVAAVKPGRVLYEIGGVPESIARRAIEIVGSKLPIRTRSIIRDGNAKEM